MVLIQRDIQWTLGFFLAQSDDDDDDIGADFSVDFALACTTSVPSGDASSVFGGDGLDFVSPGIAGVIDEDDAFVS